MSAAYYYDMFLSYFDYERLEAVTDPYLDRLPAGLAGAVAVFLYFFFLSLPPFSLIVIKLAQIGR
jgi:hypothetical protein